MIFEDVHWIDPTSLEVLGRTVERLKTLSVLLVITYRPDFRAAVGWTASRHFPDA
jgi:predicted ATPase